MKKPSSVLEYPLVIRKVLESMTISAPDLSLWHTIALPPKKLQNNHYVTVFSDEYALLLGRAMIDLWKKTNIHIKEKKWAPAASDIKNSVRKSQKALSVPKFCALVNDVIKVSEDTIRRDIDKKKIKAYKTSGGHRRIPASELGVYLELLRDK